MNLAIMKVWYQKNGLCLFLAYRYTSVVIKSLQQSHGNYHLRAPVANYDRPCLLGVVVE